MGEEKLVTYRFRVVVWDGGRWGGGGGGVVCGFFFFFGGGGECVGVGGGGKYLYLFITAILLPLAPIPGRS